MKRAAGGVIAAYLILVVGACGSRSSLSTGAANRVCESFARGRPGTLSSSVPTHTAVIRRLNSVEHLHLDVFLSGAPRSVALCIFNDGPPQFGDPAVCSQSGIAEYFVTPDGRHSALYPCS